jgi:putative membrane protein
MLELVALTGLGVCLGAVTGSIPGIHPNTVVFSSFPLYFSLDISLPVYICFVAGISVSHTFHDFLPAIYLSAPSAESAVASLPGAEMAKEGRGREAFIQTVNGGLVAVLAVIVLSPVLFLSLKPVYSALTEVMPAVLGFFLLFIIFRNLKVSAFFVAGLSGILGVLAFRLPVNQSFILMPIFTGLFAAPAVFEAWRTDFEVPEQEEADGDFSLRGGLTGFLSGLIAGTVPGVGAGAATSFLSPLIDRRKEVLTGLGAVNTSDIFISLFALFLLDKARSGASVAVKSLGALDAGLLAVSLGSSFLAVGLAVPLAPRTQDVFLWLVRKVRLKSLLSLVVGLILILTWRFTGFLGILALFTSSAVGLLAWREECRTCAMSVLIVPALLFYLGVGIFI